MKGPEFEAGRERTWNWCPCRWKGWIAASWLLIIIWTMEEEGAMKGFTVP